MAAAARILARAASTTEAEVEARRLTRTSSASAEAVPAPPSSVNTGELPTSESTGDQPGVATCKASGYRTRKS